MPFETENIMKLDYVAEEDEILQKIEAGDPSLPLQKVTDTTEKTTLSGPPRTFFPKKEITLNATDSTKTTSAANRYAARDAQGIVKPNVLFPDNGMQMSSPISAVTPTHYQQKSVQEKKEMQNETLKLIPTYNKRIQPEIPDKYCDSSTPQTKANFFIPIASDEEKIRVFLQSIVDEEFLFGKKFDSTGFLNKYATYGHGLHCPLFAKCCMDVFTDSAGILTWRIHDAKEPLGWNCSGNYLFGNDSGCVKSDVKSISASFHYKRTSFVKYGNTVLFKLADKGKEWGTETWEIVRSTPQQFIMRKTDEYLAEKNASSKRQEKTP